MGEYNPYSLSGKTIFITGASSGIGRATAIECAKLGARCIITARNEARLADTMAHLEGEGHRAFTADLSSDEGIDAALAAVAGENLAGFVANAGISRPLPVQFVNRRKMSEIFPTNLESPILLFSALLKRKALARGSSAVFTSSINGVCGGGLTESLYAATKAGLAGFAKAACLDCAPKGIRVNCVCPGMTETAILAESAITAEQLAANAKGYPLGRHARAEEVAWAIIYLLSDASSFVTGANLVIDGGISNKLA